MEKIKKFEIPIFIDLKLYDIPNTVKQALSNILQFQPEYTTLHLSGGSEMLTECVKAKNELHSRTKLIGVTMLTSFNDAIISEIGIEKSVNENVKQLTQLAVNCGMDGIVCSPLEISEVKNTHDFEYEIHIKGKKDLRPVIFDFAHDNGLKILKLQMKNESLEQLFNNLTA